MRLKNGVPLEFDDICDLHTMYLGLADKLNSIRRNSEIDIVTKEDGSPVTNGDVLADKEILSYLSPLSQTFSIISEEMENPEMTIPSQKTIFVDPIDGTKHFIEKKNPYFSLLGIYTNSDLNQGFQFRADNGNLIYNTDEGVFIRTKDGHIKSLKTPSTPAKIFSMKRFSEQDRSYFFSKGFVREQYQYEHLEMLHPLFSQSLGMISRRSTWFWDLCAPASIMKSAGYRFIMFNDNNQEISFNHAPIKCSWWACLHPDYFHLIDYFL